jgi:transcriptional regulator with XRE-family HTH domain
MAVAMAFDKLNDLFSMLADRTPTPVQELLSANLRRLRIARHLSLSELARATGMGKATLSGVESGRSNPTIDTLAGLADALRVPLSELLEELPLGEVRVVRASQSRLESRDGVSRRGLDTLADGAVEVAELAWEARRLEEPEPRPAGSRAHVYVLQGILIAGPIERVTELGAGDYATFPIDVPHVYETRRSAARALVVTHVG